MTRLLTRNADHVTGTVEMQTMVLMQQTSRLLSPHRDESIALNFFICHSCSSPFRNENLLQDDLLSEIP
jgi:hypothetical protein